MAKGKCDKVQYGGISKMQCGKRLGFGDTIDPKKVFLMFVFVLFFCRSHVENVVKAWGMNSWEMDQMKDQDSEYSQTH